MPHLGDFWDERPDRGEERRNVRAYLVEKCALPGERAAIADRLTARGESLRPALNALYAWGEEAARELPVTIDGREPHGPVAG